MPEILRAESVSFRYPGREVFRDLNLSLEEGEIVGLIGPEQLREDHAPEDPGRHPGAGAGEGSSCEGKEFAGLPRAEVARTIAVVPQEMEVPFSFTAGEIVLMGRAPYLGRFAWEKKKDLDIAREGMALTDVLDLEKRPFFELSQGEKQRVLMARALAQEPKVILLDEPTSHLDINHQVELNELIRRLNEDRNLTVLNISHDLNLAAEYSPPDRPPAPRDDFCRGSPRGGSDRREHPPGLRDNRPWWRRIPCRGRRGWSRSEGPRIPGAAARDRPCHLRGRQRDRFRAPAASPGVPGHPGVLNAGDTDQKMGKTLGLTMALEEPFSPISERSYRENQELIRRADRIVVERFLVGPGNLLNLQAAIESLQKGKKVIVLENDLAFDFTGGEAANSYREAERGGAVFIPDHSRLLEEVEKGLS